MSEGLSEEKEEFWIDEGRKEGRHTRSRDEKHDY